MAFEPTRTRAWAFDTLSGDATFMAALPGGLWLDAVPADVGVPSDSLKNPVPYAILSVASAPDHVTGNQTRVWSDPLLQLKLYALQKDEAALEAAADRADALLQKHPGAATTRGGNVLACYREQTMAGTVVEAGRTLSRFQLFYRMPTQV